MNKDPYQPISCDFYDELEIRAMRRQKVEIIIQVADGKERIEGVIKTLYTKSKEEFLVLENGREIRLDALISIDGKELKGYC